MRASRILILPVLLIVASGCAGRPAPEAGASHDPDRAREALVQALEAWKRGEARGLARRSPPIRFVDDDLAAGRQLAEYDIEEPDAPILPHADVDVILLLRDKRGETLRREARYQVATDPGLAVLRTDR